MVSHLDGVPWCLSFLELFIILLTSCVNGPLAQDGVYKKRVSLVVVISNRKVFSVTERCSYFFETKFEREWTTDTRRGLQEACSLFLRSFDFRLVVWFLQSLDCF